MTKRRLFNRRERLALYIAADGKCQNCGQPLDEGFHADHVHPFSRGGETDVINGQALCSKCNISKSNKVGGTSAMDYREWQNEEHEAFLNSKRKWFMVVATPGAGKTTAMMRNAVALYEGKQIDLILVVAPTLSLKQQWKDFAADKYGLQFIQDFYGYYNEEEFDGAIVTYQQMAMSPAVIKTLFAKRNVFVILDEPHHMGDANKWGDAAKYALSSAYRGVMGSGTPFRTDKYPIPFVEYPENRLHVDYHYTYGQAFADQVVRGVFFRKVNVNAEWVSYDDEIVTATFNDEMPERRLSELLNITLSPRGEWMQMVLKQAINDIRHIRRTEQANAGLLIVCKDTYHAGEVAKEYELLSGVRPVIVSSNEEHEDTEAISTFRDNDAECIIAVDMISEGVDIPRLRGLIYATNKVTPLYFEQIIGRIVRIEKGYELANGLCYLPSDPRLLKLADEMRKERDFIIEMVNLTCPRCGKNPCACQKRVCEVCGKVPCVCPPKQKRLWEVISVEPVPDGGIYGDNDFTENELTEAGEWRKVRGYRIPIEEAARIYREMQAVAATPRPAPQAAPTVPRKIDTEKQRNDLKNKCASAAWFIAINRANGDKILAKSIVQKIHIEWMDSYGGEKQGNETIAGLERKLAWLNQEKKRR